MKLRMRPLLRRVLKEEQGQSLIFIAAGMLAFVGVSGISMDLINAYAARQALQASTNSAALSGASYLFSADTAKASTAVIKYSSLPGSLNAAPNLTNVNLSTPTFSCLSTVKAWGLACVGTGTAYPNGFNSMSVTQTADVPTWFAKIFGIPVFHLSATAYASPGSAPQPLNLAIILDSTLSMTEIVSGAAAASDPQCSGQSEMYCALNGIGILLNSLPSPKDAPVALFAFPNVRASTATKDINCGSGTATGLLNSTPTIATNYGPTGSAPTYEIVPFSTDYTSITKAVGVVSKSTDKTTTNGCLQTPNGAGNSGTFLAGAIVAAQSALVAENIVHPVATGQNVMIIFTDANVNGSDQYAGLLGSSLMYSSGLSENGLYPSGVGGCGQAVQEATVAKSSTLQTSIFVLAYGSPTVGNWNPSGTYLNSNSIASIVNASNCPSDQNAFFVAFNKSAGHGGTLTSSTNVSSQPNISPCTTAQDLATPNKAATETAPAIIYFYSDTQGGVGGCPSAAPVGSMASIFQAIAGSLPRPPRLIPAGTP
jgi:Flp pilus assembly protein TadG